MVILIDSQGVYGTEDAKPQTIERTSEFLKVLKLRVSHAIAMLLSSRVQKIFSKCQLMRKKWLYFLTEYILVFNFISFETLISVFV